MCGPGCKLTSRAAGQMNSTTKRLSDLEGMLSSSVSMLRAKLAVDSALSPEPVVPLADAEAAVQGGLASGAGLPWQPCGGIACVKGVAGVRSLGDCA